MAPVSGIEVHPEIGMERPALFKVLRRLVATVLYCSLSVFPASPGNIQVGCGDEGRTQGEWMTLRTRD